MAVFFITLLMDRYNDRLLPLLRQFLLIPIRINKLTDLKAKLSYNPLFNQFVWDFINTWKFVSF
jgi:hypothetical protein